MIRALLNSCFGHAFVLFLVILPAIGCGTSTAPVPLIKGFEWRLQHGGTTAGLRGLCAVSSEIAWFSGAEGTVGRTVNGGSTWELVKVPGAENVDFRDIEAFDDQTAVIMGVASPAKFYKTADGGETWQLVYHNATKEVFFNSMGFWDRMNGIAVSDPVGGRFLLIRTNDGGDTWTEIPFDNRPAAIPGEAQFAASGTCLRVQGASDVRFVTGGAAARLFYSADRGDHWRVIETPIISGTSSEGIYSVAFRDKECGIVTGGDFQKVEQKTRLAAITHDGGKIWTNISESQLGGLRECATFFASPYQCSILVIGPSGAEFSVDCGASWTAAPIKDIHSISLCPGGTTGWGVGADGKIVRFTAIF